ncbi:MAG: hypothetical protein HYZ42_00010 [Bacteroidetes bacterium]|nr:hypothetical protein [Bacteroidota bacterium]
MNKKENYPSFIFLALLIFAGIASPSNGVDEAVHKTPRELILTMLVVVFTAIAIYSVWHVINAHKVSRKK